MLAPMGLRLSEEKTRVRHIDEGFDFLVAIRGRTVMSGFADWRVKHVADSEFRVSVRGSVPTLTCVAGNSGVRSPGESRRASVPSGGNRQGEGRTGERVNSVDAS